MENSKGVTNDKLDAILAALGNVQARSENTKENENVPDSRKESSNSKSIDIQERLIKRISRNVESNVEAKTQTKDSDEIKKNADDLGDLIGGSL